MNFGFLKEPVATGEDLIYLDWVISGLTTTAVVAATGFILAMVLGVAVGCFKFQRSKLAGAYLELVRSVPFIAQVFIAYFVLPAALFPELVKAVDPAHFTAVIGTLSLGIFMSGRMGNHVYGALAALPSSQARAAKALGFSPWQALGLVLLPQALRNAFGVITSEAMNTVKNSAVIGTIGLAELSSQAGRIIEFTAVPVEAFIIILAGYIFLNSLVLAASKLAARVLLRTS